MTVGLRGDLVALLTVAIWGVSFAFNKRALDEIDVAAFTCVRASRRQGSSATRSSSCRVLRRSASQDGSARSISSRCSWRCFARERLSGLPAVAFRATTSSDSDATLRSTAEAILTASSAARRGGSASRNGFAASLIQVMSTSGSRR